MLLPGCSGRARSSLNAILYGVSFLIYQLRRPSDAEPEPASAARAARHGEVHDRLPRSSIRGGHVWLLAPTWIAINATLGLFTSQTLFQLCASPREFEDQLLMGGFERAVGQRSASPIGGLLFFLGLFYWGNRFKGMRRTTIIFYGILGGGGAPRRGGRRSTTGGGCRPRLIVRDRGRRRRRRCSCSRVRRRPRSACSPT